MSGKKSNLKESLKDAKREEKERQKQEREMLKEQQKAVEKEKALEKKMNSRPGANLDALIKKNSPLDEITKYDSLREKFLAAVAKEKKPVLAYLQAHFGEVIDMLNCSLDGYGLYFDGRSLYNCMLAGIILSTDMDLIQDTLLQPVHLEHLFRFLTRHHYKTPATLSDYLRKYQPDAVIPEQDSYLPNCMQYWADVFNLLLKKRPKQIITFLDSMGEISSKELVVNFRLQPNADILLNLFEAEKELLKKKEVPTAFSQERDVVYLMLKEYFQSPGPCLESMNCVMTKLVEAELYWPQRMIKIILNKFTEDLFRPTLDLVMHAQSTHTATHLITTVLKAAKSSVNVFHLRTVIEAFASAEQDDYFREMFHVNQSAMVHISGVKLFHKFFLADGLRFGNFKAILKENLRRILFLFFKFPKRNVFHHQVIKFMKDIIDNPTFVRGAEDLVTTVMVEENLPERIETAWTRRSEDTVTLIGFIEMLMEIVPPKFQTPIWPVMLGDVTLGLPQETEFGLTQEMIDMRTKLGYKLGQGNFGDV